jgi:hypothetical protein
LPRIASAARRTDAPELRLRFRLYEQLSDEAIAAAAKVILPVEEISAHREVISTLCDKLIGELPLLAFPETEDKLCGLLAELEEAGLKEVLAGNLGTLRMARELGFTVHGDYSLNVLNSRAMEQAKALGAADVTLSFETGLKQAVKLAGEAKRGVIAYGHLPLMTFRNCPAKGEKGCAGCNGKSELTDRMGKQFTVACRNRFYSQLLNGVPEQQRTARFCCAVAIATPDGQVATTQGTCEGIILDEPKGENGFGYDPLFFVPQYAKTFAELDSATKNTISHRGQALQKARVILETAAREDN